MNDNVVRSYTSKQAVQIVSISYRQLDYWARTDLVGPSAAPAAGSGSRRAYSYRDLLHLKVIKDLLDRGVRLPQIREVFANVEGILGEDLAGGQLVVSGDEVFVMTAPDELVALVQRPGQQAMALIVLAVEGIRAELDGAIVRELRRDGVVEPEELTAQPPPEAEEPQAGFGG